MKHAVNHSIERVKKDRRLMERNMNVVYFQNLNCFQPQLIT